jgi:hypothetical protein
MITNFSINFSVFIILLFSLGSSAMLNLSDEFPLKSIHRLENPKREVVEKVSGAKVLLANYELIRNDFEEAKCLSDTNIDNWLLETAAFISIKQLNPNQVNTPITTEGYSSRKIAYRPHIYGRALIFPTKNGLIDAKGAGAIKPAQCTHSNGLLTVGEGIREYIYEALISEIFAHYRANFDQNYPYKTVNSYAVIDLGFDVIHKDGSKSPAGLYLRQAHDRFGDPKSEEYNFLSFKHGLEIERVLRLYGITSAGVGQNFALADIQGTKKGLRVVDFGAFITAPAFYSSVQFLGNSENDVLEVGSYQFNQPLDFIKIPFLHWGYEERAPSKDFVRFVADLLAQKVRYNALDIKSLNFIINQFFFAPVIATWNSYTEFKRGNSVNSITPFSLVSENLLLSRMEILERQVNMFENTLKQYRHLENIKRYVNYLAANEACANGMKELF